MALPKVITDKQPFIHTETLLAGYRGSIAHDMYIPNSDPNSIDDKDIMIITIPPIHYYFGLEDWGSRGTKDYFIEEYDIVAYELLKFVSLLRNGNPNVLSLLWLKSEHYLVVTPGGQRLIDNRNLFLTKKIYHSFVGYAYSQLKRMEANAFNGYMGAKRKQLVEKHSYDTKNAAHLIRLLKMGIEALHEGTLYVARPDNCQLLDIKTGKWTIEEVKQYADDLFNRIEAAYDGTILPSTPDNEAINNLCVTILQERFQIHNGA